MRKKEGIDLPEQRELHRYREKVRYRLMREHPEWSEGQIKEKISEVLEEFRKSHKAGQKGQKSSDNNHTVRENSRKIGSSEKFRTWIRVDHSIGKGQIVLSESFDGISWRYVGTLRKEQSFERNGLIIVPTWHKGTEREESL